MSARRPKTPGTRPMRGTRRSAPRELVYVYISLGANRGNARRNVVRAIQRLRELSEFPLLKSSLWETDPVDCPRGSPPFVNAVVGLLPAATLTPERLLERLQAIEKDFGRRPKKVHNEARPLDLDLIAFGQQTRSGEALTLPHPRAHLRRFVLAPLSEIAVDLILPGQIKTVAELLEELPPKPLARRLGEA